MNLYYALTNYHLLCCILHIIKYNMREKNILYLSSWHPDCEEIIENLKKIKIFDRVEIFVEVDSPSGNKKISNKQIDEDINKIIKRIPNNFILDVNSSKNIYIAGDHYCGSIYLVKNKKNYNYFEDACGILSDEERLLRYLKNSDYSRYQIVEKLQLLGNNDCILKRYGDLDRQLDGYKNIKDIHFSVTEILKEISNEDINIITSIFSKEKIKIPNDSILFLTFHYVSMQLLNLENQELLYKLIVDYFAEDKKLVIKPHPSDIQPEYMKWFPDSIVLPRKMPSELLPRLNSKKFLRGLTAYSTSVSSLKEYCNDIISFSAHIEKNFYSINKYYFILQILKKFNNIKEYEIYGIGMDDSIINNILYEYKIENININYTENYNSLKKESKKIILIDKFNNNDLKKLFNNSINKNDIIIILNFNKLNNFILDNEEKIINLNKLTTIFLTKSLINKNKEYNKWLLDDENISIYCHDDSFNSHLYHQNISKKLKYSNIIITMETNNTLKLNSLYNKVEMLEEEKKELKSEISKQIEFSNSLENEIKINKQKFHEYNERINKLEEEVTNYKYLYNEVISSSSWKITRIYRKVGGNIKKIIKKGGF